MMRLALVLGCLMLCAGKDAAATPLSYNESVSGDFGEFLPAASVLALDLGLNTIAGQQFYFPAQRLDLDSFAFSIPAGARLAQITYAFTASTVPGTTLAQTMYRLGVGNAEFPFLGTTSIDILGVSPLAIFGPSLPIGPGVYGMANIGAQSLGIGSGWSTDYTWTFRVDPAIDAVPEPASLLLCATGVAGLLASGRRRRRSAA